MEMQNTAHFVMQSKGGAGKSVVAALLAQYLKEMNHDLILIDTDPSNKTLGSYKSLNVQKIEVLNKSKLVDQGKFDGFINDFLENNKPMLVDTGSGDFLAINGYMIQNEIPAVFAEMGKQLIIHVPLNFGQSKEETLKCLMGLAANHPSTPIVVWENEFFGENETDLVKTELFKRHKNLVSVIKIRSMNADTEEKDFAAMLQQSLTFDEVANTTDNPNFGFIQKTRIKRLKAEIWEQLDALFDLLSTPVDEQDKKTKK